MPYQSAFARVLGAYYHLRSAHAEGEALGKPGPRTALARFYIERLLPDHEANLAAARAGAEGLYALTVEELSA